MTTSSGRCPRGSLLSGGRKVKGIEKGVLLLKILIFFCLGRTPRYEWSSSYYRTSTTTTTTSRPRWGSPDRDRDRDNSYQQQTISRGVSRSDGRPGSAPGPFSWYNETHHYDRTRPAYDPDLQGTTAAPDSEKTWDEEEWDGRDFFKPHFNEPHPLAGSGLRPTENSET